jgi:hypothetical protein
MSDILNLIFSWMHFKIFSEINENFKIPIPFQAFDTVMNCRQIKALYTGNMIP